MVRPVDLARLVDVQLVVEGAVRGRSLLLDRGERIAVVLVDRDVFLVATGRSERWTLLAMAALDLIVESLLARLTLCRALVRLRSSDARRAVRLAFQGNGAHGARFARVCATKGAAFYYNRFYGRLGKGGAR